MTEKPRPRRQSRSGSAAWRRAREESARLIVEFAPVAIAMFDRDMRYLVCSRRWLADYGLGDADLIGRSHYEVFPEIPERWKSVHRRVMDGETMRSDEDRFERADGSIQWLRWEVRPWYDASGAVGGIVMLAEDITDRKEQQAALVRSEASLAAAQSVASLGSWELDLSSLTGSWSAQMFQITGRDPALGVPPFSEFVEMVHADDRENIVDPRTIVEGNVPGRMEYRFVRPDGSVRWVESLMQPIVQNGTTIRVVGTTQDITERKLAETALERRNAELDRLTQGLVEVHEAERRSIARALHDEVGELLTGLRLNLESIASGAAGDPLAGTRSIAQEMIQRVRDLSLALRPSILDDLGLAAALRWQCDRVTKQGGIEVRFSQEGVGRRRFAPEVETVAYRIVQEALTNILRHAAVGQATVRASATDQILSLEIVDRGAGFDIGAVTEENVTGGLSGMRDRAAFLGGRLKIESVPGLGTRVFAELPILGPLLTAD